MRSGKLWMRVVTTFYRRAILMVRDLAVVEEFTPKIPVRIAPLADAEHDAYRRFRPGTRADELTHRVAKGDVAYVAWLGDRIVHAAWVATGRVHVKYLGRDLLLQPGEMLIYDSHTLPEFRESGISRSRMLRVFRDYRDRGYTRCLGVVAVENESGRRAVESGGYREAGGYVRVRLGPWDRCWRRTPSRPGVPELAAPLRV